MRRGRSGTQARGVTGSLPVGWDSEEEEHGRAARAPLEGDFKAVHWQAFKTWRLENVVRAAPPFPLFPPVKILFEPRIYAMERAERARSSLSSFKIEN